MGVGIIWEQMNHDFFNVEDGLFAQTDLLMTFGVRNDHLDPVSLEYIQFLVINDVLKCG